MDVEFIGRIPFEPEEKSGPKKDGTTWKKAQCTLSVNVSTFNEELQAQIMERKKGEFVLVRGNLEAREGQGEWEGRIFINIEPTSIESLEDGRPLLGGSVPEPAPKKDPGLDDVSF